MKSAEEWIDNELALLMGCKPQELKVIPKEYAKMVAFIEQIQQDAIASARDAALDEAANVLSATCIYMYDITTRSSVRNAILALRTKPTKERTENEPER